MRKSRRLVLAVAVSGLVAAGGITLGLVANANTKAFCDSNTNNTAPITCTLTSTATNTTISTPSAIQAVVNLRTSDGSSPSDQYVLITYSVSCSLGSASATTTNPSTNPPLAISKTAPVTDTLTLAYTNPDRCTVTTLTATLQVSTDGGKNFSPTTTGSFQMILEWTPATSPSSASPSPSTSSPPPTGSVPLIKGFGGKCLDDKGNSSANRTKVIIWTCNGSDKAQAWTFSAGELKHNGKCANDQGNGGSGSKVILWTCNGASNEKWFHSSTTGEFILRSQTHGLLCLTDPGYSKTNGTQLVVSACRNTSNQHWS